MTNIKKKEAYFDVTKSPTKHLISTKIENADKPGTYLFTGNLTIKGITKPIKFSFTENKNKDGLLFAGDFDIDCRNFNAGGNSFSLADKVKVSLTVFAK